MKKLVLLPIFLILLTGCSAGGVGCTCSSASNKPIETVTLSSSNFSKYVATYSNSTGRDPNYFSIYYTHFVGADNCKFIDCTVTYAYTIVGNQPAGSGTTIPLSISGDGETEPFTIKPSNNNIAYHAYIIAATGTVEVYR